ncbi:MAG: TRAP transporter small permease [Firmicutes bacterium]|nr:TRAP transporter small permease [Bacillota bacterium]
MFSVGSQWIFEMCTFLQVTMLWFGVATLLHRDEDIKITVIYDKMPPIIKKVLDWFSFLIITACAGMLTYGYILYLNKLAFSKSPVMRLPNYIYFGSLSIGIVLICLVLIFKVVKKIRNLFGASTVPM